MDQRSERATKRAAKKLFGVLLDHCLQWAICDISTAVACSVVCKAWLRRLRMGGVLIQIPPNTIQGDFQFGDKSIFSGLRKLDLSGCGGVTDSGVQSLSVLVHLRHLDLTQFDEVSSVDSGVTSLSVLNSLEYLSLAFHLGIQASNLNTLSTLVQLTYLDMRSCLQLNDDVVNVLSSSLLKLRR